MDSWREGMYLGRGFFVLLLTRRRSQWTFLKVLCDKCYDITSVDLLTTDYVVLDYVILPDVTRRRLEIV